MKFFSWFFNLWSVHCKLAKALVFTLELEWYICRQCIEYACTRIFVWSISCWFYLL